MMQSFLVTLALCLSLAAALPPDKLRPYHIIRARSIDLYNAHSLALESRLEKSVEPTGYQLQLEPYLEDGVYKGRVRINVTWMVETDEVSIHCGHDLTISLAEVHAVLPKSKELQKIEVKRLLMDPKKPIATLRLADAISKGTKGQLDFTFNGNMETFKSEAFFKSSYMTEQEVERIVAATQLRPNNARRMFPCFDEPAFKAPFQLSVVRPKTMLALSNVPVARTEEIPDEPNAVWDHFETTPPMSTFTFGLVIADLKQLGNSTYYKDDNGNNIELRVWGRPEYLQALEGVNERLARVFAEVAKYWKVPLPLRRLDIVALPNYQGARPADNWGLIVFKESELSMKGYLQLAQEISYQWVGSLTSPHWWSDAHINKALVVYIAAEAAFKINNGIGIEGKWPMTMFYSLYYEYSKRYPHSRITGMKQETASTKIELVFKMFNSTLGQETVRNGLRKFIEDRKFKTFTREDIWSALDTVAHAEGKIPENVNVNALAKSWNEKDRLPLLTVDRQYDKNTVTITQKLFLRERPHDVPNADKMMWQVPIVMIGGDKLDFSNTRPAVWMSDKTITINKAPASDRIVIVNPEEIVPCPVNYDERNWYLITQFLQSEKRLLVPDLTRAKLLHDAWNLAYAGELSFATALNVTLFLKEEKHLLVWDPLFTMIDHIGRHICQCLHGKFQAYVRSLLTPLYIELTKDIREDEDTWRKNLRRHTKDVLCAAGYKPCVQEARTHFKKWMDAKDPDEGNPISNQYICPVFKWGTNEEWDFGLRRVINFPSSRKQSERTYLLKTLAGCPVDSYKINYLLNVTILEDNLYDFTESDIFLIFSMLTGSSQGYETLFHFLNNNWDALKAKFASKTNLWDNLISSATAQFTTQEGLELVSNLYVAHQGEFGSAEHIIEKSMRNIREEATWSAKNLPVMDKWLDNYLASSDVKDAL